jgi:hypothetical protein
MLGLPKSVEIRKYLHKKTIFDRFKIKSNERRLFDEQINRLSIVAEISPNKIAVKASESISAIFVVLVMLKTSECDKKNIILLSKLINQCMLFVLQTGDNARLAAYRADKVLISESKPITEWELSLKGFDLETVWENLIVQIGNIIVAEGNTLDEQIIADDERAKTLKCIKQLEKQALTEKQPRRKWDLVEKARLLKMSIKENINNE